MAPSTHRDLTGQSPSLDKAVSDFEREDCLPCRTVGATAFIGLGIYSYVSGQRQLRRQRDVILRSKSMFGYKTRQAALAPIALTFIGMGIYRFVN